MMGFDGRTIQPTNKTFKVDFCTVAHSKNGKIVEENLFYDQVGMMTRLDVIITESEKSRSRALKSEDSGNHFLVVNNYLTSKGKKLLAKLSELESLR
jgi:hypothetical protein